MNIGVPSQPQRTDAYSSSVFSSSSTSNRTAVLTPEQSSAIHQLSGVDTKGFIPVDKVVVKSSMESLMSEFVKASELVRGAFDRPVSQSTHLKIIDISADSGPQSFMEQVTVVAKRASVLTKRGSSSDLIAQKLFDNLTTLHETLSQSFTTPELREILSKPEEKRTSEESKLVETVMLLRDLDEVVCGIMKGVDAESDVKAFEMPEVVEERCSATTERGVEEESTVSVANGGEVRVTSEAVGSSKTKGAATTQVEVTKVVVKSSDTEKAVQGSTAHCEERIEKSEVARETTEANESVGASSQHVDTIVEKLREVVENLPAPLAAVLAKDGILDEIRTYLEQRAAKPEGVDDTDQHERNTGLNFLILIGMAGGSYLLSHELLQPKSGEVDGGAASGTVNDFRLVEMSQSLGSSSQELSGVIRESSATQHTSLIYDKFGNVVAYQVRVVRSVMDKVNEHLNLKSMTSEQIKSTLDRLQDAKSAMSECNAPS